MNVPGQTDYQTAVVAFIDHLQVPFTLDGVTAEVHRRALAPGEHYFSFQSPPLSDGVHRLAVVFLDDDHRPGLFGWHELLADVYVGAQPRLNTATEASIYPGRADPAIAMADYAIPLTTERDSLRLAGNVKWQAGLTLWAAVVGSARGTEQVVMVTALQDFRQLSWPDGRNAVVRSFAGRVSPIPLMPLRPIAEFEQLRVLLFTNPQVEIAPHGTYDESRDFRMLASQKVILTRP